MKEEVLSTPPQAWEFKGGRTPSFQLDAKRRNVGRKHGDGAPATTRGEGNSKRSNGTELPRVDDRREGCNSDIRT